MEMKDCAIGASKDTDRIGHLVEERAWHCRTDRSVMAVLDEEEAYVNVHT